METEQKFNLRDSLCTERYLLYCFLNIM